MSRRKAEEQAKYLNLLIEDYGVKHRFEKDKDRLVFQHDRDRIVWSTSFKRLAHKTQIFPPHYSDHHRRRLTHSLEVMQLSTSIAWTLGLNALLCEAIALAHDLGHTPFGHAGEDALNLALKNIVITEEEEYDNYSAIIKNTEEGSISLETVDVRAKNNVKGLSTFTHYEQGVDNVKYISTRDPNKLGDGLDLSDEISDGILKHTWDHSDSTEIENGLENLLKNTKYDSLKEMPRSSNLESQVVRICDKISYLISDIDDGLHIGALHIEDLRPSGKDDEILLYAESLKRIPPYHINSPDYKQYALIKDSVIKDIVHSIIESTLEKIDGHNWNELKYEGLLIDYSDTIKEQVNRIYEKLQKDILFENYLVKKATSKANHIVSCLFCQYLRTPEQIPWRFRRKYLGKIKDLKQYSSKIETLYNIEDVRKRFDVFLVPWHNTFEKIQGYGNPSCSHCTEGEPISICCGDIICAKDYVAGMTDNFAEDRFLKDVDCVGSKQLWKNLNMDFYTLYSQ